MAPRRHVTGRVGSGGAVTRRCPTCRRDVIRAYRGDVTAVGSARIVRVTREGDAHAQCECGATVVWKREASHIRR